MLKGVMEVQPGTSMLPTLSAKCWASPAPQRLLGMVAHMADAQTELHLRSVVSIALVLKNTSLTVLMTKPYQAIAEPVVPLVEAKMISSELNVQVRSKS